MDRSSRKTLRCAARCCAVLCGITFNAGIRAADDMPWPPAVVPEANTLARREWLRWWIFELHPSASVQAVFDDNITISSRERQSDLIWVGSPGIHAVAGDPLADGANVLKAAYIPSFSLFTQNDQYNSIDHTASVSGLWPFSKLKLGFRQTFDQSTGGIVDVGNRVERQVYHTRLTSSYELSEKSSFEINAQQQWVDYPAPLISTKEWSNDNWLNHLVSAKVILGLGLTAGYVDVDENPNQHYEQVLLRAVYNWSYKLDLTASAGGEFRQYHDGPSRFGPVFSIGATYWPGEGTTLVISAHRDNRNSALLAGQNYISTGFNVDVRQRIRDRISFHVGGSYERASYESAVTGVAATRSEDYYLVHSGVDLAINDRGLVGLFYRYRQNVSNGTGFAFSNNQFGLQTSYQF